MGLTTTFGRLFRFGIGSVGTLACAPSGWF